MILETIHLENFKSHKDTLISCDDVITTIVGSNSSGKSNILNAIKLIVHNTDFPESWIRNGQTSATVTAKFTNGVTISRTRSKTKQSLSITKAGKTQVFEGKKDASEYVQEALGIKKVVLDNVTGPEDLNFIHAKDPFYIIESRYDTVQRKIASILGFQALEDARNKVTKDIRDLTSEINTLSTTISTLSSSIVGTKSILDEADKIIKDIDELNNLRQNQENKLKEIEAGYEYIHGKDSLNTMNNVVDLVFEDISNLKEYLNRYSILTMSKYEYLDTQLPTNTDRNLKDILSNLGELSSLISMRKFIENSKDLNDIEFSIKETIAEIEKLEEEIPKCEVCGQPI